LLPEDSGQRSSRGQRRGKDISVQPLPPPTQRFLNALSNRWKTQVGATA